MEWRKSMIAPALISMAAIVQLDSFYISICGVLVPFFVLTWNYILPLFWVQSIFGHLGITKASLANSTVKSVCESANQSIEDSNIPKLYPPSLSFRPRLVVFDKDGTLIDFHKQWGTFTKLLVERILLKSSLLPNPQGVRKDIFTSFGFNEETDLVVPGAALTYCPMSKLRSMAFGALVSNGISELLAEEILVDSWRSPDPRATSFPLTNLPKLFQSLKAQGTMIAVNTTDDREPTLATLEYLKAISFVDHITCGDDKISPKPAPDSCLACCHQLGVPPSDSIMVGDTLADIRMGKAAGFGLCLAVGGGSTPANILATEADIVIPSIDTIHEMLD
jgi:phosphoglycolate phosphatase-like HAD superfamily hydrolase